MRKKEDSSILLLMFVKSANIEGERLSLYPIQHFRMWQRLNAEALYGHQLN